MTPMKPWFGLKRIGWGWSLRSIEGWVVIGVFAMAAVMLVR